MDTVSEKKLPQVDGDTAAPKAVRSTKIFAETQSALYQWQLEEFRRTGARPSIAELVRRAVHKARPSARLAS